MIKKEIEVLAPAGNFEKLKTAILFGANAVYLAGQSFGLRAFADNFTKEEMKEAVDYAHKKNVNVYVTLNILARSDDLTKLPEIVKDLSDMNVDAVIISDPGVFSIVRSVNPNLEIHISTQASVTNEAACNFWYQAGARRIVLARELSLTDISTIRKSIPEDMTIEAFCHGAMCMSWSGRCLLSNVATNRDANRGACSQPCRWKYHVTETRRLSEKTEDDAPYTWEIEEDETGSFLFSSNDLCMIDHIPKMIEAGVNSFKIEGRMKGSYYAGITTKIYREAIDRYIKDPNNYKVEPYWHEELNSVIHRPYDTGFYFDDPMSHAKISQDTMYCTEATVVATVTKQQGRTLTCIQKNKLVVGDVVDIVTPTKRPITFTIQSLKNDQKEEVNACPHPKQVFYVDIPSDHIIPEGSFIRRMGKKYGES